MSQRAFYAMQNWKDQDCYSGSWSALNIPDRTRASRLINELDCILSTLQSGGSWGSPPSPPRSQTSRRISKLPDPYHGARAENGDLDVPHRTVIRQEINKKESLETLRDIHPSSQIAGSVGSGSPTIEDLALEIRLLVFQFYYLCSVGDEAPGETQGGHQSPRSRQASRSSDRKEPSESSKRKRSQRSVPSKGTDVEHQDDDDDDDDDESLPPAKKGETGPLHDLRRNFGCWFYKWAPQRYPQCTGANGKNFHSFRRVCAPLSLSRFQY